MIRAISSLRCIMISPVFLMISARWGIGTLRQDWYALPATSMALITSSFVERGKIPTTSQASAGFRFSNVRWPADSTSLPPIMFLYILATLPP
jgi:hypothetical protein